MSWLSRMREESRRTPLPELLNTVVQSSGLEDGLCRSAGRRTAARQSGCICVVRDGWRTDRASQPVRACAAAASNAAARR
ncbi:MAG: hypothetical protein ACLU3I_03205 [Acutalibacteraceae bacterium]